jgi:hypothetical protein
LKYEPSPEVWVSRCSSRIADMSTWGSQSGSRCFESGSSTESFPCSASCRMATAVNILFIDPRLNFVSMRFGTP